MKKILISLAIVTTACNLFGQKNNPYNHVGIDYVKSVEIIISDFKKGTIKEFSNEAIQLYSKKLPLKAEVNMDLVANVSSTIKNKGFSLTELITKTDISDNSKSILIKILLNPDKLDVSQMKTYLEHAVDEINKNDISISEKEIVLSLISISYNLFSASEISRLTNWDCTPELAPGINLPNQCVAAGVIAGGIIGLIACGPLCGIGGAIVGGLVGSLS